MFMKDSNANSEIDGCKHFRELTSAYRDGELMESERASMQSHLDSCADCREVLTSVDMVAKALSNLPKAGLSRDIAADVERLLQSKSAAQSASSAPGAAGWQSSAKAAPRILQMSGRNALALAVAAAVLALCAVATYLICGQTTIKTAVNNRATQAHGAVNEINSPSKSSRAEVANGSQTAIKQFQEAQPRDRELASTPPKENQSLNQPARSQASSNKEESSSQGEQQQLKTAENTGAQRTVLQSSDQAASLIANRSTEGTSAGASTAATLRQETGSPQNAEDLSSEASVLADSVEDGNIFGQIGLGTDEDGLYAIKM